MDDLVLLNNKYYISVSSTYADDKTKVLNHEDTFGIFDRWGNVKQIGEEVQGIYHNGMRYISELELRINGVRPLLLSSTVKEENEILSVDLTNPTIITGMLEKDIIYIGRSKFIRNGACFEQITLNNFDSKEQEFEISLEFNADFRDIFEVRGIKREKHGDVYEIKHLPDDKLRISYMGLDKKKRVTEILFSEAPSFWENHNKAIFKIRLAAHEQKKIDYTAHFLTDDEKRNYVGYTAGREALEREIKEGNRIIAGITTGNKQFNQWLVRSRFDLLSLLSNTQYGKYPYAGVPWYNTIFGRDGIITAMQTLWLAPGIAQNVLQVLAATQATEVNEYQDAEPGKIVHEMRSGEMVELKEIPFKRYYGSVDATPLFVILAGVYYKRTGDLDTIKHIWKNIEAALEWIDKYGDITGDGFIKYKHKSKKGLTNQGWKDSVDSISHSDGSLATSPIALCEVQGYVYDARVQAAMLARKLGDDKRADELEQAAESLKEKFNKTFWNEELGVYVIALDGENQPCDIVASNAGHCMFSGISDEEKAAKMVSRLLQPDMFNNWGVRTLSSKEKRYNPMSYHNGSVWPHDVSLIAKGFSRYGYIKEAVQLTNAMFKAALFIELQRLPELFCGFEKRRGEGPTNYPVACSPQAWAVASVFMMLEACLNVEILAEERKVYFRNPVFPQGVDKIEISNLQLGNENAHILLLCSDSEVFLITKSCPAGWKIELIK